MFELRLLGGISLQREDGTDVRQVLAQAKRLALLAYLSVEARRMSRDSVIGVFWPEVGESQARANLRRSLSFLRSALSPEIFSGDHEDRIGVTDRAVWCDVRAFRQAVEIGDHVHALELYQGDLMTGFYLAGSPEFEMWMEAERHELRVQALSSALVLSEGEAADGDLKTAVRWARRGMEIAADSESMLQWLLYLYDRTGDRAAAARAYRDFKVRLEHVYGIEPSAQTRALMADLTRDASSSGEEPEEARAGASRAKDSLFRDLVERAADAIYTFDRDGRIRYANPATGKIVGRSASQMSGTSFLDLVREDFRQSIAELHARQLAAGASSWSFEFPASSGAEPDAWYAQVVQQTESEDGSLQAVARDVTARRRAEGALRTMGLTDKLTELYNRRGFLLLAEERMKLARRTGARAAVVRVRLCGIEGSGGGRSDDPRDLRVLELARLLRRTLRESDLLARWAEDTFMVFAPEEARGTADVVASRVNAAVAERNALSDRSFEMIVEIGLAIYDSARPTTLGALVAEAEDSRIPPVPAVQVVR